AVMIAGLGWERRDAQGGGRGAWLGAAFVGVALADLARLSVFDGMPHRAGLGESGVALWVMGHFSALIGLSGLVLLPQGLQSTRVAALLATAMAVVAGAAWWGGVFHPAWLADVARFGRDVLPPNAGVAYATATLHAAVALALLRQGGRARDAALCRLAAASWVLGLAALSITPLFPVSGFVSGLEPAYRLVAWLMICRAIYLSDVRRARELRAGEGALLRAVIDSVPDPIAFRDARGVYLGCNEAFAACYGRPERALVGRTDAQIAAEGPWAAGASDDRGRVIGGSGQDEEWVVCRDGDRRLFERLRIPFRTQDGVLLGELGISRDITDLRWIEEQLAASERRLALALESAALGLWDWHVPSGWVSYDALWLGMLGFEDGELEPARASWEARVHADDWPAVRAALEPHLLGETPRYTCEHRLRHKDGHWVWVLAAGCVIERDEAGAPIRVVGIHQDISQRKSLEERLLLQATSDPLTGLANRRHFEAVLANEMARVKRNVGRAAVVLLDLDHFKRINDRWGHAAGDEVLKQFTAQIAARLRDSDVFARLGGEEFAILLPGVDLVGGFRTAERLRRQVAATPVVVEDGEIPVTVSIGVANLRAADPTPAAALARADAALYRAKDGGRNRSMMEEDEDPVLPTFDDEAAPGDEDKP
ncbi:diguanylate cyclase, partial [Thauera sp. UPWRP]